MKTTSRQILYFTKAVFLLLIFILQTVLLSAQDSNSKQKGLYLGFNAGTFVYQGDLTPSPIGSLKTMQPGFTVSLTNDITDRISLRYMLTIATLKGEDIKYQSIDYFRSQRRFSFKNDFAEFAFGEKFYLHRTTNPYRKLNPYITAGIGGMLSLNAVRNSSQTNFSYFAADNLQSKVVSDSVHGVPRFVLVVPVGAGVDIRLNDHIFLNVEGLYRFSSSDYLDGFSLSGNNRRNDYYYGISTGIHFLIQ
ncbi:MAG: outer membrane beta-barrel protein [Bacteroidetes bacterium]|nr:outer membrane beta-barrel protein [Bacteroidota bacterium]